MEDVVFSQIDFGLLMPLLENDDITDISYSNNGQLWVKTLSRGVYAEHIEGLTNEETGERQAKAGAASSPKATAILEAE